MEDVTLVRSPDSGTLTEEDVKSALGILTILKTKADVGSVLRTSLFGMESIAWHVPPIWSLTPRRTSAITVLKVSNGIITVTSAFLVWLDISRVFYLLITKPNTFLSDFSIYKLMHVV
jgi:hypothetical protein